MGGQPPNEYVRDLIQRRTGFGSQVSEPAYDAKYSNYINNQPKKLSQPQSIKSAADIYNQNSRITGDRFASN